jgi:DNA invertase Pin-like site-specific DNA recombinase
VYQQTLAKTLSRFQGFADKKKCIDKRSIVKTLVPEEVTTMTTVGVYCRVSTDKQENGNQLDQLREFASKQGWAIIAEYVDTVTGSGKKTRPNFERMMLDASQRRFDLLLFWKLDRLSREGVRQTLTYLERLDSWGVAWRSFQEPYLDSCGVMKDLVISVMSLMAQQERISISERTKAGMQRAVKAGRVLGRRAVVVDIARARQLRQEGLGLRPIARKLGCAVNTLTRALKSA